MAQGSVDLDSREMLTLIHTMLNRVFFDTSRDESRELYQAIAGGGDVPFMTFQTHAGDKFACRLALDSSAYKGKLNFGSFRAALAAHLHRIAGTLTQNRPVNLYTSASGDAMIFHHPGLMESHDGQVNILVTGIEQRGANDLCVKLQFLDPGAQEEAMSAARE